MKRVQIAFYKGTSRPFNYLTAKWTKGPYSHCELIKSVTTDGQYVCLSSSFMDGGVRSKVMDLPSDKWDILEVGLSEEQASAAFKWFDDHDGDKYDVLGLANFIFSITGHAKNRWFCSEALAEALGIADSWRFDPNTLYAVLSSLIKANRI